MRAEGRATLAPTPCEVCGGPSDTVRQSRLPLPVSCAYCTRCEQEGLGPAHVIEAFIVDRVEGKRTDEWLEFTLAERKRCDEIVKESLIFHGIVEKHRSLLDFPSDVE